MSNVRENNVTLSEDKIRTFTDGGKMSLSEHKFISEELNKKKEELATIGSRSLSDLVSDMEKKQDELPTWASIPVQGIMAKERDVEFKLNETGNIFYSTTSDNLHEKTLKLFDSVSVLFAAINKALCGQGKSLFDYDACRKIILGTGLFIEIQKFKRTLQIVKGSLAINTQVIQQLLPGLTGGSLEIAKSVLEALNGELAMQKSNETAKLGHLLFICEELFGAPSVIIRLFFLSKSSHVKLTSSPCHTSAKVSFEQLQEADTFLFVSPENIAEYASKLKNADSPDYQDLIKKMEGLLTQ